MGKNEKYTDLETRISDYFLLCDALNEQKKKIIKPYTLSGLADYIGISRRELERLALVKRYEKLIQAAKTKIEAFIEEKALTGELSSNASSNSLKYNFGWGEKKEDNEEASCKSITLTLSPEMAELAR